jgi:aminodeoxyfutalosine deaminase
MQYLSADCIIPVSGGPCYNSVLAIEDNGTIAGVFNKTDLNTLNNEIRHYSGILCPGFVNTHCHLEFSWARGLITEGEGLDHFVRQLERFRRSVSETFVLNAVRVEATEMEKSGIVATADISNGNTTLAYKKKSSHYFHTFVEIFGSNPDHAEAVFEKAKGLKAQFESNLLSDSVSIVPHATYSLSEELFRLISSSSKSGLLSIHHQESEEENRFFKDGSGLIKARRTEFNPDIALYPGTGKRPMESIAPYFNPDQKILLVHNTVSEQQDIDFIEKYFRHAYWCLCPNANLYIENRLPDIRLFRSNNCRITLGTDSLASNHQLSILEEIKTIQHHFPEIPLTELIRWGTLNGASFLGVDSRLGSFEKGKNPGVVLIENVDIHTLQLKPESTSRLIIPAQT